MSRAVFAALAALILLILGACVNASAYRDKMQTRYPPVGERVASQGEDLHVIRAGETGPPVLMIHGASANAREFTWTLAPRLSGDHRVMMMDRPGHGWSGRPDESEQLRVQAQAGADTIKALAPGEQAVVVGHSYGGAVALRLGLDHPDLVKAIVLLAPVSHDWGGGGEAWYNTAAGIPVIGSVVAQLVPLVGPGQAKSGVEGVFDPQPVPEGYYEKSAIGLLFRPEAFKANAADMNALRGELAAQESRYGELSMPVVIYSGAQDTVIDPGLHARKLAREAGSVELVKLPDEGHMPHHGEGPAVAERIRALAAE